LHELVGNLGGVAGTNTKAYSSYLKDYPEGMSLSGERLAAEAYIAAENKASKPSKKKAAL
jgi:hypothetical protein